MGPTVTWINQRPHFPKFPKISNISKISMLEKKILTSVIQLLVFQFIEDFFISQVFGEWIALVGVTVTFESLGRFDILVIVVGPIKQLFD
jgi:hypothetical protein